MWLLAVALIALAGLYVLAMLVVVVTMLVALVGDMRDRQTGRCPECGADPGALHGAGCVLAGP